MREGRCDAMSESELRRQASSPLGGGRRSHAYLVAYVCECWSLSISQYRNSRKGHLTPHKRLSLSLFSLRNKEKGHRKHHEIAKSHPECCLTDTLLSKPGEETNNQLIHTCMNSNFPRGTRHPPAHEKGRKAKTPSTIFNGCQRTCKPPVHAEKWT